MKVVTSARRRFFGGQVLGQALTAASYTITDRTVHSLHAYFLRAGDVNAPIVYDVDRSRDGKTFSNRRVGRDSAWTPDFQYGCLVSAS